LLVVLAVATPFLPPPASPQAFAVQGLVGYFALAGLAVWLDRARRPISARHLSCGA
jgi:hypothetical protein